MTQQQTDYWFRPKTYGYGAEPANTKGWLATGVYVAVVWAIALALMVWPAVSGETLEAADVATFVALMVAVTVPFIWLCWVKTDGVWRWRWGKRD